MSTKIRVLVRLIVLSGLVLFLYSCDIGDPTEGLEVRLNNIVRTTYVSVDLVDASTGDKINTPVKINFGGEYAQSVISVSNEPLTELYAENGILLFCLDDSILPSEDNPAGITVVCKADNYLATSKHISLIKKGVSNYSISMTNLASMPSGTVTAAQSTGSTNSATGTSQQITVSSGTEPSTGASASINLPAGTLLYGSNGEVLSGNVETRVTYFNPIDEESLEAFPGGFNTVVQNQSGTIEEGFFISAGFVAIDMTVQGKEVESFSNNLTVNMTIPDGAINPETGSQVQSGDAIPLWSYDEDSGEWVFEAGTSVSAPSKPGALKSVSFPGVKHLSYWNLDWHYSSSCSNNPRISFQLQNSEVCSGASYYILKATFLNRTGYLYTGYIYTLDEDVILYRAPANTPVRITLHENYYDPAIASVDVNNLCDGATMQVNNQAGDYRNIHITVKAVCGSGDGNPKVVSIDGYPIYAREEGTYNWQYLGSLNKGELSVCLKLGASYYAAMQYKGKWYYSQNYNNGQPYTIENTEINFNVVDEPEICRDF